MFLFRNCTEVQKWFQEFSEKVTTKATNGAIKILKNTFSACGKDKAWMPPYDSEYSNPSKLANIGGRIIGDREFGNRELGCYLISEKPIWGFSATK